jgi:hypothetical protein
LLGGGDFTHESKSLGCRILFTLLFDPTGSGLQGRLAQKVDHRSGHLTLELDIASVKDTSAFGFAGMVFQVPMSGHIVKITALVVIQSPRQTVIFWMVRVIIKGSILQGSQNKRKDKNV